MSFTCTKLKYILFLLSYTALSCVYAADDHGNNCSTATVVDIGTNNIGELTDNDSDFFSITLPGNGRLTLFTAGDTNTFGKLFDANGLPLIENDNSAPNGNFLISKELDAGEYCLKVSGSSTNTQGIYSLQVEGDFFDDDHGSSCDNATQITDARESTLIGKLSTYADADYFLINLPSSGHLTMFTSGDTNTVGKLFDSNGIPLIENDNSAPNGNFLISEELEAGEYCLKVSGNSTNTQGIYSLQIEGDFFDDDHGTDCGSATTINSNSIVGELSRYADSDFFRVKVPDAGGSLILRTEGETNTFGELFDPNGIFLVENDNSAPNGNFLINQELKGGTYCLKISGNSNNTVGVYTLITEGDFIPVNTLPPLCSGESLYDPLTEELTIPNVRLGNSCYSVKMKKRDGDFIFDLTDAEPAHR